jgi:hypothetical protein
MRLPKPSTPFLNLSLLWPGLPLRPSTQPIAFLVAAPIPSSGFLGHPAPECSHSDTIRHSPPSFSKIVTGVDFFMMTEPYRVSAASYQRHGRHEMHGFILDIRSRHFCPGGRFFQRLLDCVSTGCDNFVSDPKSSLPTKTCEKALASEFDDRPNPSNFRGSIRFLGQRPENSECRPRRICGKRSGNPVTGNQLPARTQVSSRQPRNEAGNHRHFRWCCPLESRKRVDSAAGIDSLPEAEIFVSPSRL